MALETVPCYNPSYLPMSEYLPTIGIEIHAELKTKTKMFCSSINDAAEIRPNTNVCPVCLAHPGTLPVINKAAVSHVLRVGTALGSKLADYTEFDRKNYFYPDLPKGYQISQFDYPLVSGGALAGIELTRIHLEEDTASSIHDEKTGATLVDYNRAGVPLMELVTEPVIHSAEAAGNFGRELQLLLRCLEASEADMEKGQMRLEANISVTKLSSEDREKIYASGNVAAINAIISSDNSKSTSAANKSASTNTSASANTIAASTAAAGATSPNASNDYTQNNKNISANDASKDSEETDANKNSRSMSAGTIAANVAGGVSRLTNDSGATPKDSADSADSVGASSNSSTNSQRSVAATPTTSSSAPPPSSTQQSLSSSSSSSSSSIVIPAAKIVTLGTKVEVKNINSFRAMERAIQYEVKRQIALIEKGEKVVQETRGWDENKQATFSQRVKEGSADYRYFPDPDLPSLKLTELNLTKETIAPGLPELPWQRRERYSALGINTQDVELYVKDDIFGGFFEEVARELGGDPQQLKLASNYIGNDLVKLINDIRDVDTRDTKSLNKLAISPANFAKLIRMISAKKISSRSAKELLAICVDGVSDPEIVAKEKDLLQESASADISPVVAKIIADNPTVVADFRAGKAAALEYLLGQGMKALRGSADPMVLREEIKKQLI